MFSSIYKTFTVVGLAILLGAFGFVGAHLAGYSGLLGTSMGGKEPTSPLRAQPARYALADLSALREEANGPITAGLLYLQKARENPAEDYLDRAEASFKHALESNPSSTSAMNGMGMVNMSGHRFKEAMTWAERVLAKDPRDVAALGIMVDANIELGRYEEAVRASQKMVDTRPDMRSYSRVSYVRELMGDLDGAIDAMQRAVSAGSGNVEHSAWSRVYLGHLYVHASQRENAEEAYHSALHLVAGYGPALAGLARLRTAEGRLDDALALYSDAIAAYPIPEFFFERALVFRSRGDMERARAELKATAEMLEEERAGGMDVDEELAEVLLELGASKRAAALAEGAYERRPTIHNASILSRAYLAIGRLDAASRYADESTRFDTPHVELYEQAERVTKARLEVKRATGK